MAFQGLFSCVFQGKVKELLDFVFVALIETLAETLQRSLDILAKAHPLFEQLTCTLFVSRIIIVLFAMLF